MNISKYIKYSRVLPYLYIFLFFSIAILAVYSILYLQIFSSVIAASAALYGSVWTLNKTRQKEIEARLFPEKALIYKELIDIVKNLNHQTKGWEAPIPDDELPKRLSDIRYRLLIWGSPDMIRAIDTLATEGDTTHIFIKMASLFSEIRKDLGHKDDSRLYIDFIIGSILENDRAEIRKIFSDYK